MISREAVVTVEMRSSRHDRSRDQENATQENATPNEEQIVPSAVRRKRGMRDGRQPKPLPPALPIDPAPLVVETLPPGPSQHFQSLQRLSCLHRTSGSESVISTASTHSPIHRWPSFHSAGVFTGTPIPDNSEVLVTIHSVPETHRRAVVLHSWDSAFYHVRFRSDEGEGKTNLPDEVVERHRLKVWEEPKAQKGAGVVSSAAEVEDSANQRCISGATSRRASGVQKLCSHQEEGEDARNAEESAAQELEEHVARELGEDVARALEEWKRREAFKFLGARTAELERLQQRLDDRKKQIESAVKLVFEVEEQFKGLAIGKQGSNVRKAEAIEGVISVEIAEGVCAIVALSEEAAEQARDLLEFMEVTIPVTARERSLIIGRGGSHVRELQEKCGLLRLTMDGSDTFRMIGCRKAIRMARKSIELISRYVHDEAALNKEVQALSSEVRQVSSLNISQSSDRHNHIEGSAHMEGAYTQTLDEYTVRVDPSMLGVLIGPKGATIRQISAQTGCRIEIEKEESLLGFVYVQSEDQEAAQAALAWIEEVVNGPPRGSIHDGTVTRLTPYGVSVSIRGGTIEGFVHVSQMREERVENAMDVVQEGEAVRVRVLEQDERRKGLRFSMILDPSGSCPTSFSDERAAGAKSARHGRQDKPGVMEGSRGGKDQKEAFSGGRGREKVPVQSWPTLSEGVLLQGKGSKAERLARIQSAREKALQESDAQYTATPPPSMWPCRPSHGQQTGQGLSAPASPCC